MTEAGFWVGPKKAKVSRSRNAGVVGIGSIGGVAGVGARAEELLRHLCTGERTARLPVTVVEPPVLTISPRAPYRRPATGRPPPLGIPGPTPATWKRSPWDSPVVEESHVQCNCAPLAVAVTLAASPGSFDPIPAPSRAAARRGKPAADKVWAWAAPRSGSKATTATKMSATAQRREKRRQAGSQDGSVRKDWPKRMQANFIGLNDQLEQRSRLGSRKSGRIE